MPMHSRKIFDRHRFMPYPELVESAAGGVPYRIFDSAAEPGLPSRGVTDKVNRRLFVPLSRDGRPVSRHEIAHVHWSPLTLPRVRYPIIVLHAVEDARINLGLAGLGIPVDLDPEQIAHVQHLGFQDLKSGQLAGFTLRWVASLGTNAAPALECAALEAAGRSAAFAAKLVRRVHTRLERARRDAVVAPFETAKVVARELAKALAARGALDPAFREIAVELSCSLGCDEDSAMRRRLAARMRARGIPRGSGRGDAGEVAPGRMRVVEAPLTLAPPPVFGGRHGRSRLAAEGPRIGSFHRWAVDRAVFRRRGSGRGGAVSSTPSWMPPVALRSWRSTRVAAVRESCASSRAMDDAPHARTSSPSAPATSWICPRSAGSLASSVRASGCRTAA
jgi:hypothetical protein